MLLSGIEINAESTFTYSICPFYLVGMSDSQSPVWHKTQNFNIGSGKAFDSETDSFCHERKSWIVVKRITDMHEMTEKTFFFRVVSI